MVAFIQHGSELFTLYEGGEVGRPTIKMAPSGQWRVIGAVERNNFGHAIRFYSLAEVLRDAIPWQFKNGKQRTFIRDLDHGTIREWRSPRHYVIRS